MTTQTHSALSHWGWGLAARFPARAEREALAEQVGALLGLPGLQVEDPVPLEALRLRPPRLPVPPALADIARTDPAERARHTYGRAYPDLLRGMRGDFSPAPDLVLCPRDEAEVQACLAAAAELGAAVVPFGGGTSVVGGVECDGLGHTGVISLDLCAMDRVLEVEPRSLSARIQAGARGPGLEAQLAAQGGLTLRHYPQSFEYSTLGGWIATRAGGHFSTLFTHIDDLVQSVRMVTPTGTWQTRHLPASGAGPSADRLVLGSEGILGVITEAWMRVRPRPTHRSQCSVSFPELAPAVEAVHAVSQSGLYPSLCRLLDRREAMLHGVSFDGDHVLLLGFEGGDPSTAGALDRALALATAAGGRLKDGPHHRGPAGEAGGAAGSWRQAFLEAPYLFTSLVSLGLVVDTFETACTWDRFDALHAHVVARVRAEMKARCGGGVISCRFTHVYPDGPAPYYTFIARGRPGEELAQWAAIKAAACEAIGEAGGTITHHHAVGRTHRKGYDAERPEAFARVLRAAKRELDPDGLLNPGVLIDPPGHSSPSR